MFILWVKLDLNKIKLNSFCLPPKLHQRSLCVQSNLDGLSAAARLEITQRKSWRLSEMNGYSQEEGGGMGVDPEWPKNNI